MSAKFFDEFLKSLAAHVTSSAKRRCFTRRDLISILFDDAWERLETVVAFFTRDQIVPFVIAIEAVSPEP